MNTMRRLAARAPVVALVPQTRSCASRPVRPVNRDNSERLTYSCHKGPRMEPKVSVGDGRKGLHWRTLGRLQEPGSVKRPNLSTGDFHDWDALATQSLEAARQLPKGPERIEALKQAGRLRMATDRKRIRFAPLGRRPTRGLQGYLSITR
jgi:hypothetical protein